MRGLKRSAILTSSAIVLAAATWASAQTTIPAPSTLPAAEAAAPANGTSPITAKPTTTLALGPTTQPEYISFSFRDAPIETVLQYLSKTAGYIIYEDVPVTGRVTVFSDVPVKPEDAVRSLDGALKNVGLGIVIVNKNMLKITSVAKILTQTRVISTDEPNDVPQSDEMLTVVIPVKNVDAVRLRQDLQPLVSADAELSANALSNSIMIVDTGTNVHRILQIVHELDSQTALASDVRVTRLLYADATSAAKLVTDIFGTPTTSQNTGGGGGTGATGAPGGGRGGAAGGGRGGGAGGAAGGGFGGAAGGAGGGRGGAAGGGGGGGGATDVGNTGHVTASADTRTNTVVYSGPVATLDAIEAMLKKLDADPSVDQTFFFYAVRNGTAVDMAQTLNALFGNSTGGGTSRSGTTSGNAFGTSSGSSSGFGGGSTSGGGGGGGGRGGGGGGGSSGSSGLSTLSTGSSSSTLGRSTGTTGGGSSANAANSAAASELIGQVYVVADADTNSLLVATATKYEQQVRTIIAELDRPIPQVLIKCLIAEVTHDNTDDYGLDFSALNLRPSGEGQSLVSNLGNAAAAANGGLAVNVLESNLTATLHALATAGKLDVLSRPYILGSDNQPSSIVVGQEVPIVISSQLDAEGNTINQIQYQSIGVILDVTPHINPDGMVVMNVAPTISALTDQSVPISSNVSAPVFDNRSASTIVEINDGETIVIGGMMQDQLTTTINKIPILGDIPLVGKLFSRTQDSKTKTELLIFLTPHVAQQPERLKSMTEDEVRGTVLTPTAVGPGVMQQQLRGMARGGTATQPALTVPKVKPGQDPATPGNELGDH